MLEAITTTGFEGETHADLFGSLINEVWQRISAEIALVGHPENRQRTFDRAAHLIRRTESLVQRVLRELPPGIHTEALIAEAHCRLRSIAHSPQHREYHTGRYAHDLDRFNAVLDFTSGHPSFAEVPEVAQMVAKVLEEEVIMDGPYTQQHMAESLTRAGTIFEEIFTVINESDSPSELRARLTAELKKLLARQKSGSYNQDLLQLYLPRLIFTVKASPLNDIHAHEELGKIKKGMKFELDDGADFVVEAVGHIATSSCSVYRVLGVDGRTLVVKAGCSDGAQHDALKNLGLPVFKIYQNIPGGMAMDDLDENGTRVTLAMNCMSGSSWLHLRDNKVERFENFDDAWLENFFYTSVLAARGNRFIPGIAYFFNCGKTPVTDLRSIIGDYGELDGFKSRGVAPGNGTSLLQKNASEALRALEAFLYFALQDSSDAVQMAKRVYKTLCPR